MTTPQPDYQRLTGQWLDEDAAMDTFSVRLPRWRFVRLFGRNPLVRASDRVEALVLVLAVVVSLLAAPIAAAVGTAVHDSRRHVYAEQAQTRHMVTATVMEDGVARTPPSKTVTVRARWFAAGAEHTGAVQTRQTVKPGDSIDVWVDRDGSQVGPPMRSAVHEAVTAALAIWLGVAIAAAALVAASRAVLNRVRHARWQHDFDKLVGDRG
ncbi:MAG: Rv1733c family protein [Mycobacterium sp.]